MRFSRSSGILLHFTSLPGGYGIGDFGPCAYEFADFLSAAGQKLWQVLPLNPTGYGDSPYQCFSAFAGNPLLISLEHLYDQGLLQKSDLDPSQLQPSSADLVDYGSVIDFKMAILQRAAKVFFAHGTHAHHAAFDDFCEKERPWLDDYALFMACKDAHQGVTWTSWDPEIRSREAHAISAWSEKLGPQLKAYKFWQFEFFQQWEGLKTYCQQRGIRFMGDVPIYVAHDSADVWAHPELFYLDPQGRPSVVSGVPPDYFSATGQLWGNPITGGTCSRPADTSGGSSVSAPHSHFSISFDSIIFAASNPTGRFPEGKRRPFMGIGSRVREKNFSGCSRALSATCRSWQRISV